MKTFEVIYALSKNKANVGDKYKIDGANREVIKITNSYVYLDNKNYFPVKMFGTWMRIAKAIEERDELSLIKAMKLDHKKKEIAIMHKEAKAIYDEKYRQPAINRMAGDTSLKLYVALSGVGDTIKFYFSPTTKSDLEDLELSYKSLHGVAYKTIMWGYYIQHENNIILVGTYPYKDRNLSDKRKKFALVCLKKEKINNVPINLFVVNQIKDLFPTVVQSSPIEEKKHWSGLNGDIATSMIDQAIDDMYRDDDYPF